MKKAILLLAAVGFMALGACSRKTCPAYSGLQKPGAPVSARAV